MPSCGNQWCFFFLKEKKIVVDSKFFFVNEHHLDNRHFHLIDINVRPHADDHIEQQHVNSFLHSKSSSLLFSKSISFVSSSYSISYIDRNSFLMEISYYRYVSLSSCPIDRIISRLNTIILSLIQMIVPIK